MRGHGVTFIETGYKRSKRKMEIGKFRPGTVFIGMPMDDRSIPVYEAIVRTCAAAELTPLRVDQLADSGPIPIQILQCIEQAEFLVFDLTSERPNVYYELGYAHGVGNKPEEIVLIAQAGTRLHFDISSLRTLEYTDPGHLETELLGRFKRMVEKCRPKRTYREF